MKTNLNRRDFLKVSAAFGTAAATLSFPAAFGLQRAFAADDDAQTILNIAATAETFATTHYYRALSEMDFNDGEKAYMLAAMESELLHRNFLIANGAKPIVEEFYFPEGTFADNKMLGTVTSVAETVFVAAYLAAVRRFAELEQPLLSMVAGQVAVVEGQHLLFMKGLAGTSPANDLGLADPLFYNVSDAVPVISGLLDGKSEVAGIKTETTATAYPGDDAVNAMIGDKSFLQPPKPATDPATFPMM